MAWATVGCCPEEAGVGARLLAAPAGFEVGVNGKRGGRCIGMLYCRFGEEKKPRDVLYFVASYGCSFCYNMQIYTQNQIFLAAKPHKDGKIQQRKSDKQKKGYANWDFFF